MSIDDEISADHSGGTGAVWLVQAFKTTVPTGDPVKTAIFGSIAQVDAWVAKNPKLDFVAVPYVVDDPDWGEETIN